MRPPLNRTLSLEPLEIRKLLSVNWNGDTGALTVNGTAAADTMSVSSYQDAGDKQFYVYVDDNGTPWYGKNPGAKTIDVASISVDLGAGGDGFGISLTGAQYETPSVSIQGGTGDDTISGSHFGDTIEGGTGDDDIDGGADGDYVYGGPAAGGTDSDDVLYGGTGDDFIYGGNGNDTLYGGEGADYLYGEAGVDYLYGNAYQTWGDDDSDRLDGGSGTDFGYGELAADIFVDIESVSYG